MYSVKRAIRRRSLAFAMIGANDDVAAPHEDPIDLHDLTDAPDAPASDPTARLVAGLGAEIVDERSRD